MVEQAPQGPLSFKQKSAGLIEGTKGKIVGLSLIAFSLGEAAHVTRFAAQGELTETDLKRSAVIFGTELALGTATLITRSVIRSRRR